MLKTPGSLANSPDDNVGLYDALVKQDVLDQFITYSVQHVYMYCVDTLMYKI